jgi:hypothetical protein
MDGAVSNTLHIKLAGEAALVTGELRHSLLGCWTCSPHSKAAVVIAMTYIMVFYC